MLDDNLLYQHYHDDRFLQDTNSSETAAPTPVPVNDANTNDSAVLRATFVVYGSVLLGVFVLFCYVRRKFPRPYNLRNWVEDLKTPIAANQFGFFSWLWQLNAVTEDEILTDCGLDALCFLRVLRMGYRIAVVACFNAIWLLPVYATAPSDEETVDITDRVAKLSIAHVPVGSKRLVGTVIAAYILFGYVMYLILAEFEWFIEKRHKYLKKPRAQNYSVYVRNIPDEYKSNAAMLQYFRSCFSDRAVLEARLRIQTPALQAAVAKRDKLVGQLEHALVYEEVKREKPTHRSSLVTGEQADSIPTYASELKDANDEVSHRIEEIEQTIESRRSAGGGADSGGALADEHDNYNTSLSPLYSGSMDGLDQMERSETTTTASKQQLPNESGLEVCPITQDDLLETTDAPTESNSEEIVEESNHSSNILGQSVHVLSSKTKSLAKTAVGLIPSTEEGTFYSAGFVTFSSLRTTSAALQMIHHDVPFKVEAFEAPRPEDIFWANVGRSHKDLEVGNLLSLAATAALCLLWTIPITFIASLSSVEALAEEFEWIEKMIEAVPFIGTLLGVLAPLFVKIVNALLPVILELFSMMEGPVSCSVVAASLFTKLAAFMIIQTFFVSAISSGLLQKISDIIENPSSIINLLAVSLPAQATYFIQIVFVGTVVMISMELLRVKPLILALIRRFLPPNLNEKERQTTVFGIRPLADPADFEGPDNLAQIVLNFIVMLVYAVIAPLTTFIQAFCFMALFVSYRHNFVFIYPANPDSGGKIWTNFIKILMTCMLIAQFTIVGLMALKQAAVATPLMIPLIVITVLFNGYVRQQHFRVAEFLPTRESLKEDLRNGPGFDLSFTTGAYLQDDMQVKKKLPENLNQERALMLGLVDEESSVLYSFRDEGQPQVLNTVTSL